MISKRTELCSRGLWYQQNHLIELQFFNWSLHISNLWLLYSPARSSYKGKLWWQETLSWHFLAGANQYKSRIAFVDISQGEQHGRYHCQSLIAMKGQPRQTRLGIQRATLWTRQRWRLLPDKNVSAPSHRISILFKLSRSHPALLTKHYWCQKLLPFCVLLRGKDMLTLLFGDDSIEWISAEHRKPSQAGSHCIRCRTKT